MLRAGGLVAFPTETVYGLGGNALDRAAVRGIFAAKGRPADDPLIVHLASPQDLEQIADANPTAQRLAQQFWPGPLTLVVRRRAIVPPEVTAGLDTVAVRVPSHPVAHALLEQAGLPLAAPSANLFSRPSPTLAAHVLDDLSGRIDAVLDGGPATLGVESTIVDVTRPEAPRLLRPGGLPAESVAAVLGVPLLAPPPPREGAQRSPGLLAVHYSPRTPLVLIVGPPDLARTRLHTEVDAALAAGQRVGALALDQDLDLPAAVHAIHIGGYDKPSQTAACLFQALRALDQAGLDVIYTRELADPAQGLGRALSDRLRRAAQRVVVPQ